MYYKAFHSMLRAIALRDIVTFEQLWEQDKSTYSYYQEREIVRYAMYSPGYNILDKVFTTAGTIPALYSLPFYLVNPLIDENPCFRKLLNETLVNIKTQYKTTELSTNMSSTEKLHALKLAILLEDDEYIGVLLDHTDCHTKAEALIYCLHGLELSFVKKIMDGGLDFSAFYPMHGKTPLHLAVENRNIDLIELLLRYNVDVNAKDTRQKTLLDFAINYEDINMCALLLRSGCYINNPNKDGHIPLYRYYVDDCFSRPLADIGNMLIKHGSHLNGVLSESFSIPVKELINTCQLRRDHNYSFLRIALKAGLRINYKESLELDVNDRKVLKPIREEHRKNQLKLMFWCRITIRNCLIETGNGRSIYPSVQKLTVPLAMKSYLMLEDTVEK